MNEITEISKIQAKKKIAPLSSKSYASMDEMQRKEEIAHLSAAKKMREVEIEMQKVDHAFALVEEIRDRIKDVYEKLEER